MSFFDLLSLIFENLGRRKARVAMTAIGVIIGAASVVVLVSLGIGMQRAATAQFANNNSLVQIEVYPGYPQPGEPVETGPNGELLPKLITDQTIADITAIPGVVAVVPRDYVYGEMSFSFGKYIGYPWPVGMGIEDLSTLGLTAERGDLQLERGAAIIGINVPNNFMDPKIRPGQEMPPPPDLFEKMLRMTLIKYDQEGNQIRKNVQIRVTGIIAQSGGEADWSMYVPMADMNTWNEWFRGKRINRNVDGYNQLIVRVSDSSQTTRVYDQIVAMGYQANTLQSLVEGFNSFFLIMQVVFGGIGAISLLVAAIGIANTMTMAILERTREIGLMKAVGATNRDVLSIFLGEAAGIGFIGGLGGILFGWSAGQIIDVLGKVYMAGQMASQSGPGVGMPMTNIAVSTPPWLLVSALIFSTLIGLLSGVYPALRAATVIPILALKYE